VLLQMLGSGHWAMLVAALLALFSVLRPLRLLRRRAWLLAPGVAALALAVGCGGDEAEEKSPPIEDGTVQTLGEADRLLFNDPLGSVLAVTTGSGKVEGRFASYPFGATRFDTTAETRLYTDAQRDRGVGLDLMGARSYAPDLGVWTSGDPLAVTGPDKTVGGGFATANPYAYAALTPLIAVDRDGNSPALAILARAAVIAYGAYAGGAVAATMEHATQVAVHGRVVAPGRVKAAAVGGAIAGAFTGGAGGYVYGTVSRVALGASAGVVYSASTELVASGGKSAGSPKQHVVAAGTGALGAGIVVSVTRGASSPQPSFSGCNGIF
jgi:RHS repeat-associated protein